VTDLPDHAQRFGIFQRLSSLPVAQLNQIIFTFHPPSGNVSPSSAPSSQRVTELLEWVESPIGCGLANLEQVLDKFIPRPPELPKGWFLAHPYGMPPNFTGRKAELQTLSNWLQNETQYTLFVLRALGGFGKSALTWHWLTHEVDPQQFPQVVWWSFYEDAANFKSFLRAIHIYLTGQIPKRLGPKQQLVALLNHLEQHPVLIVMDGFERELRAYSGMGAAYQGDEPLPIRENGLENKDHDCINPLAEIFLRNLSSLPRLRGKVLISSRLRPHSVELHGGGLLQGCQEHKLTEMRSDDAVEFFHCQGIQGNRGEIEQVCRNYGFHPLSLRLLAGYVSQDFEYPGDIRAAANLDLTGDLVQHRNHVLKRSYESLTDAGRQLLGQIACFRNPVAYEALAVIEQGDSENSDKAHNTAMSLQVNLRDLINRGLLQQDTRSTRQERVVLFDLHPIVRAYAYDRMAVDARTTAHSQLRDYFAAVPIPEKVTALDDLVPSIELYHHMVRAGQYDEALDLFAERLNKATYYQLGAYQLRIELLRALFPQGEEQPPQIQDDRSQSWVLNVLANSYSLSGQPGTAVALFELGADIHQKRGDKTNLVIILENLAHMAQFPIGALQVSESNLRRSINLCQEIEEEYDEAIGHAELGHLLAYQGAWSKVEVELDRATELFGKLKKTQYLGITCAYRSLARLLRVRAGEKQEATMALAMAIQALEFADEDARTISPIPRDYVRSHWLLGAAHRANDNPSLSETHLSEALTRCRTINLVDAEADILLDLARLRGDQNQPAEALHLAHEALAITERSGYVLQGADVRLFLAQQALEAGDHAQSLAHAQIARQLATCDGGDYVYRVAYDEAGALLTQLSP
jgi:hypothetical protein